MDFDKVVRRCCLRAKTQGKQVPGTLYTEAFEEALLWLVVIYLFCILAMIFLYFC